MNMPGAFQQVMTELDVPGARKLWSEIAPHLPQPGSDEAALATLHMARTAADVMPLALRAYSHRWLLDHDLPSQLPDALKPKAEQICPKVVEGVMIGVGFRSAFLKPAAVAIRREMEQAVLECYAEGTTDPAFVSARMTQARDRERKKLFGRLALPTT